MLLIATLQDDDYFHFITPGHYVVITGIYYDNLEEEWMAVVNDPNNAVMQIYGAQCRTISVPIANLVRYAKDHKYGGHYACAYFEEE